MKLTGLAGAAALAVIALGPGPARGEGCPEQVVPLDDVADDCVAKPLPDVDKVPDVGSLKTPESPAFMALGIAPSEIQRPATPVGLLTALSSGFAKGGKIAPAENFALQVNPFWLWKHPDLTEEDLESQRVRALYRNISFSVGTAAGEVETKDAAGVATKVDVTRAAFGLRTTLLAGAQSQPARACQQFLVAFLDASSAALARARKAFSDEWEAAHPKPKLAPRPQPKLADFPNDSDAYEAALRRWKEESKKARAAAPEFTAWRKERDKAIEKWLAGYGEGLTDDPRVATCLATIHERVGLMAEAAGAYVLTLPAGDLDRRSELAGQRTIGWLTVGYVHKVADNAVELTLLGVGRGEREKGRAGDPTTTRWDAGGRFVTAWQRYGVSLEATHRW
ncbi:MAG TPA: hypothetical protein VN914_01790, partial [Polyangia bacterium]|nr:hypothetical protein [Polyangia bacterium]